MKRAAVLIGVDRTGNLPVLHDAAAGARRLEVWAREQGFDPVDVITDEGGAPVEIAAIKKAVKAIVEKGTIDQLVVYFAGHGVNNARSEYWLLTDAPDDPQAAVNVEGSVALARYCGIPHVVMLSDACRTAAEGIQAQGVKGSEIFPNEDSADESPVDQFYACKLGRPSHEVRDPATTSKEYTALYTQALCEVLDGTRDDPVTWVEEGAESVGYVRPRPLRDYLSVEIPKRLSALHLETAVIQEPMARVVSDDLPAVWLSRLARGRPAAAAAPPAPGHHAPAPAPAPPPTSLATDLVRTVLAGGATALDERLTADVAAGQPMAGEVAGLAVPFGPTHHETGCGFKVRGARIVEVVSRVRAEIVSGAGDDVRVEATAPGTSVLLVFENGDGTVLPAVTDFMCALTVEDGELIDVAYEPSEYTFRWPEFEYQAADLRGLRAIASAAARDGVFQLEGDDALQVARRMQNMKGIDPTLAVYAAYAYHDLQRADLITQMAGYMRGNLGARLFDVALLARELNGTTTGRDPEILGLVPLLTQGWALLSALQIKLPAALRGVERELRPSLWTLFGPGGVGQVRKAMGKKLVG